MLININALERIDNVAQMVSDQIDSALQFYKIDRSEVEFIHTTHIDEFRRKHYFINLTVIGNRDKSEYIGAYCSQNKDYVDLLTTKLIALTGIKSSV